MLLDNQAIFADAQAITTTAAAQNVLDMGAVVTPEHAAAPLARDHGNAHTKLMAVVNETFTDGAGDNLTLTVSIEQSDTLSGEALASPETLWTSRAFPLADLTAGSRLLDVDSIPQGATARYLGARFTIGNGPATGGALTLALVAGNQTNMY